MLFLFFFNCPSFLSVSYLLSLLGERVKRCFLGGSRLLYRIIDYMFVSHKSGEDLKMDLITYGRNLIGLVMVGEVILGNLIGSQD